MKPMTIGFNIYKNMESSQLYPSWMAGFGQHQLTRYDFISLKHESIMPLTEKYWTWEDGRAGKFPIYALLKERAYRAHILEYWDKTKLEDLAVITMVISSSLFLEQTLTPLGIDLPIVVDSANESRSTISTPSLNPVALTPELMETDSNDLTQEIESSGDDIMTPKVGVQMLPPA